MQEGTVFRHGLTQMEGMTAMHSISMSVCLGSSFTATHLSEFFSCGCEFDETDLRSGRLDISPIVGVNIIDLVKVFDPCEIHRDFDCVVETGACFSKNSGNVCYALSL